jgi:hypothetical protein
VLRTADGVLFVRNGNQRPPSSLQVLVWDDMVGQSDIQSFQPKFLKKYGTLPPHCLSNEESAWSPSLLSLSLSLCRSQCG